MSSGYTTESETQKESDQAGLEYQETIALLQEEIARLESELLDRVEAGQIRPEEGGSRDDEVEPCDQAPRQELERLTAELTTRDETINVLLDQLRLVEEAESATRAEWEQLAAWVTAVEERVERQTGAATAPADEEIAAHRRMAEDCRSQLDREREAWKNQRREMARELERLEGLVAHPHSGQDSQASDVSAAITALEAENRRLRQQHLELEENTKAENDDLRGSLESAEQALAEARGELSKVQDDRDRERREFEIAMTSLRAQVSRASLVHPETKEDAPAAVATVEASPALDADMRIRAFRQHLREIHMHESEARKPMGLSGRLSRLWSRTGPK
jgi:hypothetical protein